MIMGVFETILGLLLLNTSVKSLKKSVIRKWREGFVITLITSFILLIHGLVSVLVNIPESVNNFLFALVLSSMMLALFRISNMKGLET